MPDLYVACQILCKKHYNSASWEENDAQIASPMLTRHNSQVKLSLEVLARQYHRRYGQVSHLMTNAISQAELSRVDQITGRSHCDDQERQSVVQLQGRSLHRR